MQKTDVGPDLAAMLPLGIPFELQPGEGPTLRAVLERIDGVGDAKVDQRLRADDRSCAAGAVDDNRRPRVRHQVRHPQRQLTVRAANSAGNAHLAVFDHRPTVEDDAVGVRRAHCLQRLSRNMGCSVRLLDELAEGLARNVDAGIERVSGRPPGRDATLQRPHAAVAEGGCTPCGTLGDPIVAVAQHEIDGGVGDQRRQAELEAAIGKRDGEKQMTLPELPMLPHVDQRELTRLRKPRLQGAGVDRCHHVIPPKEALMLAANVRHAAGHRRAGAKPHRAP